MTERKLTPAAEAALASKPSEMFVDRVSITLQRRGDGGLRVYSDDVPGLILSGADPVAVMASVWPALTVLMNR